MSPRDIEKGGGGLPSGGCEQMDNRPTLTDLTTLLPSGFGTRNVNNFLLETQTGAYTWKYPGAAPVRLAPACVRTTVEQCLSAVTCFSQAPARRCPVGRTVPLVLPLMLTCVMCCRARALALPYLSFALGALQPKSVRTNNSPTTLVPQHFPLCPPLRAPRGIGVRPSSAEQTPGRRRSASPSGSGSSSSSKQQQLPKPHTGSLPIPRQHPGHMAVPYPASWGSLISTSPGYISSSPNAASRRLLSCTTTLRSGTSPTPRPAAPAPLATAPSLPLPRPWAQRTWMIQVLCGGAARAWPSKLLWCGALSGR